MSDLCPYCNSKNTVKYYETWCPLFTWPLPKDTRNPMILTEVALCKDCFYAFNATPPGDDVLKKLYDNYVYVKPSEGIGYSSHSGFIELVSKRVEKDAHVVEIGSSDGYLLSCLKKEGFVNLEGMDPSPHVPNDFPISIRKEYFSETTRFDSPVDVFLLEHVFEHFNHPWEFLRLMASSLSWGGRIMIEVPHYATDGMQHQHLSYFTPIFMQTIALPASLEITDLHEGNVLRVVFRKERSPGTFFSPEALEREKEKVLSRTSAVSKERAEQKERIRDFIRQATGEDVYWWGTGSSSADFYMALDSELREGVRIHFIDSDAQREGLYFTPAGAPISVASKVLANRRVKNVLFASQFPSEMAETMKRINCTADKVFAMPSVKG